MNLEDAKRILLAWRPGMDDSRDPEIAEALELARQEPELKAWLHEHVRFQEAVRDHLRRTPVPADLKQRILTQGRVIRPVWRRPEFLLAAACLAAGLILSVFWTNRTPDELTFAGFRSRMMDFALRVYRMDIVTNDLAAVQQYLRARGVPADYPLLPGLEKLAVKGGATNSWQGRPVAMVCFSLPEDKTLYMFVADSASIPRGKPSGTQPILSQMRGVATATWLRHGKVFFVAAPTSIAELKELLGTGNIQASVVPIRARIAAGSIAVVVGAHSMEQPIKISALALGQCEREPSGIRSGRGLGAVQRPAMRFRMSIGIG